MTTIVLGLEHFIDKIGYHKLAMDILRENVLYVVRDASGFSRQKANKYHAHILIVAKNPLVRLFEVVPTLIRIRPAYIEIYHIGILTAPYALISKLLGARVLLVLRGEEFVRRTDWKGRLINWSCEGALRLVDVVITKEQNLRNEVERRGLQARFLGNCIPMPASPPPPISTRTNDILYINSIRPERHVIDLIIATQRLFAEGLDFTVTLVGFSLLGPGHNAFDPKYEEQCLALIESSPYSDRYTIEGFTDNPRTYMRNSKIFVLPAEVVYANYSLLEAMSEGCVPVVYPGEGFDKIVTNDEFGLVANNNPSDLADTLRSALQNNEELQRLSQSAQKKIAQEFSLESWAQGYQDART